MIYYIKIIVLGILVTITSYLIGIASAKAGKIKVAVIDTGFDWAKKDKINLCNTGHKDFTNTSLQDNVGHGTNVSGLIHKYAKNSNYCQVIIKYFNKKKGVSPEISAKAIRHAVRLGVDFINYSGGGLGSNKKERLAVSEALSKGIKFIAAAGNNNDDLDYECNYYPACYYRMQKNMIVVGSKSKILTSFPVFNYNIVTNYSNYGKVVDVWENGNKQKALGHTLTGTSQATAIHTGKLIRQMYNKSTPKSCKIKRKPFMAGIVNAE